MPEHPSPTHESIPSKEATVADIADHPVHWVPRAIHEARLAHLAADRRLHHRIWRQGLLLGGFVGFLIGTVF